MNIEIDEITVLLTDGADSISIHTRLPSPYCKEYDPSQTPLTLDFKATYDTGIEYVESVFGVEPRVIDARTKERAKFSHGEEE